MHIVTHLGWDDKSYESAAADYEPEHCIACRGLAFSAHDGYERWGLGERIGIRRFRCHTPGCRRVWSVLPSYLTRFQSYATAVEAAAVLGYVLQGKTYAETAAASGVSVTTAFRWVSAGTGAAALTLVHVLRTLLAFAPAPLPATESTPEDRFHAGVWHMRRVRAAKLPRLLELCVLVRCLELFAAALRPTSSAAKPVLDWGLWRWANYPTPKWQMIRATIDGKSQSACRCYADSGGGCDDPGRAKSGCAAPACHD